MTQQQGLYRERLIQLDMFSYLRYLHSVQFVIRDFQIVNYQIQSRIGFYLEELQMQGLMCLVQLKRDNQKQSEWLNIHYQIPTNRSTQYYTQFIIQPNTQFIIQLNSTNIIKYTIKHIIIYMFLWILVSWIVVFGTCHYQQAPYADWAHDHVVWLNGKIQDQSLIEKMVADYEANGIPVGGVNIDSCWSKNLNDFDWDTKKFPDPIRMVKSLHAKNIKVMLWATSVMNVQSPLYEEGVKNNYFLNKGKTIKWWHGHGAFLDFTNTKATQWWFKLMDRVLDIGIDGFKCDGTDPMILLLGLPRTSKGIPILPHQYGHLYYGNFYNHTKAKNKNALIMSRPDDSFIKGYYYSYSPKYVMFSGWVGDQDSSAEGLRQAFLRLLHSAWKGYLNFGFDIGGYRGQSISKNIFIRWVQAGALVPFMENGGNGRHLPWSFDQQTVDIYRKFVLIHVQLKPFFLSAGTEAYAKGVSVMQPVAKKQGAIALKSPESYGFVLWNSILVFPIFDEYGLANLYFPAGYKWIYFFDHKKIFQGGQKLDLIFNLNESPIFLRQNSIVPMKDEVVIVHPTSNHKKTFIYGDYSEDFTLIIKQNTLSIQVLRFYKNEQMLSNEMKVRIVGLNNRIKDVRLYGQIDGEDIVVKFDISETLVMELSQSIVSEMVSNDH